MQHRKWLFSLASAATLMLLAVAIPCFWSPNTAQAGLPHSSGRYAVLAPITHGNLTIFPVVSGESHETKEFLTLDEGLRSGDVVVTESGQMGTMIRRHDRIRPIRGDEVNRLFLVNNSQRPLLLLAGEVVTGGKQDRVVGKDRIIPAGSDADLDVFCVEPGRWTARSSKFGAVGAYGGGAYMAQPSVRGQAMDKKDQQGVWDQVARSRNAMSLELSRSAPAGPPPAAAAEIASTSSYARVMENREVAKQVDAVAAPIQHSYESAIRELRARNAVGVVVAVNGRIIWADMFASPELLSKYWPKLVRSYAAEAVETAAGAGKITTQEAQEFVDQLGGRHESVDSEPSIYRYAEISGDGFKVFELASLLPKTGFDVHVSKMAE